MKDDSVISARFRDDLGPMVLDVAFEAPARGVTAIFGPSGCGKTTLLRCIAGLHRTKVGYCSIGRSVWQDGSRFVPVHRRPLGYVFQEASLFPHLTVRANLKFGFDAERSGAARQFEEIVGWLGLVALLDRFPGRLSGGERQRVAIGRALLSGPELLLLDEPLSALDKLTKDEILPYLEALRDVTAIPMIYVSHDIAELERLADYLVLMEAGRVIASGPINSLQSDPALPLALARDAAVSLDAIVEDFDPVDGLARFSVDGGMFLIPAPVMQVGEKRRLRILAGDVSLTLEKPSRTTIINILPARILSATPSGDNQMLLVLTLGPDGSGARLLARVTRRSFKALELSPGRDVYAQVKGAALGQRSGLEESQPLSRLIDMP